MTPIAVRPTRADLSVAEIISTHTGPRTERAAEFLAWGADEHILCALAAGWWLYCSGKEANAHCHLGPTLVLRAERTAKLIYITCDTASVNQIRGDRIVLRFCCGA